MPPHPGRGHFASKYKMAQTVTATSSKKSRPCGGLGSPGGGSYKWAPYNQEKGRATAETIPAAYRRNILIKEICEKILSRRKMLKVISRARSKNAAFPPTSLCGSRCSWRLSQNLRVPSV